MNKLWLSLNLLVVSIMGYFAVKPIEQPENQITVCHAPVSGDMAQFANDPNFIALHPTPLAIKFVAEGESITYPTADGNTAVPILSKQKRNLTNGFLYIKSGGDLTTISNIRQMFFITTLVEK